MKASEMHKNYFQKFEAEAVDFTEGIFHGAVENPVNGFVQFSNHLTGSHLPELHIVDENEISKTYGGLVGTAAGTALDVFAASAATAGLAGAMSGAGLATAALRFGVVGGAYSTLLQPTDPNSAHFFQDRLADGALAFGTYATMGSVASLLDGTAAFGVAAERSLLNFSAYGSLVGAAGGAAHAELNALLFKRQGIPTLKDLTEDVGYYSLSGGFMGAYSYGTKRVLGMFRPTGGEDATPYQTVSDSPAEEQGLQNYNGVPSSHRNVNDAIRSTLRSQSTSGNTGQKDG